MIYWCMLLFNSAAVCRCWALLSVAFLVTVRSVLGMPRTCESEGESISSG